MRMRRAVLPGAVFIGVAVFHFAWLYFFPEIDPAQSRWETVVQSTSALDRYIDGQEYLLGYSYALALCFAAVAFRSFRERRLRSDGGFAVGGLSLSGFLAFAGCYLLGCCGSPMLGVYISLFGAGFCHLQSRWLLSSLPYRFSFHGGGWIAIRNDWLRRLFKSTYIEMAQRSITYDPTLGTPG